MKFGSAISIAAIFATAACSVLGQKNAQKPSGTHYSAAFIKGRKLVAFPFDGNEMTIDIPVTLGGVTFSTSGRTLYGIISSTSAGPSLAAVTIKPNSIIPLPGSGTLNYTNSVAVDAAGDKAIVSASYQHEGKSECGLFELDMTKGKVEHIIDNLSGECYGFLSAWNQLSLSPDGSRVVGTAGKGQLGVVNVRERRIEKLWPGTAAWWSPDGKWIAALSFAEPMEIELIRASGLSTQRSLGHDTAGRLQWSPDSRVLLLWEAGFCGLGSGYVGTLQALDVGTGERMPISSSRCRVDLMNYGWVSDEVLK